MDLFVRPGRLLGPRRLLERGDIHVERGADDLLDGGQHQVGGGHTLKRQRSGGGLPITPCQWRSVLAVPTEQPVRRDLTDLWALAHASPLLSITGGRSRDDTSSSDRRSPRAVAATPDRPRRGSTPPCRNGRGLLAQSAPRP